MAMFTYSAALVANGTISFDKMMLVSMYAKSLHNDFARLPRVFEVLGLDLPSITQSWQRLNRTDVQHASFEFYPPPPPRPATWLGARGAHAGRAV